MVERKKGREGKRDMVDVVMVEVCLVVGCKLVERKSERRKGWETEKKWKWMVKC